MKSQVSPRMRQAMRTAALPRSLARPLKGWISGPMRSTTEFHQNEEQKREDEKKLLEPRDGEKERHGRQHDREHRFFAEGGFVLPGGAEALKGIAEGVQKAAKARFSFERVGVLGFFVRHGAKD